MPQHTNFRLQECPYHRNLEQVSTRTLENESLQLLTPVHILYVYLIIRHRYRFMAETSCEPQS